MSTQIQRRRGTTAQHSSFTGALGETTIDTDKEVVVVHDGVQVGGYPQMRENGSNSALALGSAGTPSLKFTGDTNTGIYSSGADQVSVATGGTERLRIDSTGQIEAVSLGTAAAPTWSFTGDPNTGIYSPGADQVAISTNGQGRLEINSAGVISHKQYDRWEQADGTSVAGYVGNANLVMSSGSQADLGIRGQGNLVLAAGGGTERLRLTSTGALNFVGAGTAGSTQAVSFNGSAPVNSLVIDSSGRVGVGTSSPSTNLEVSGNQPTLRLNTTTTGYTGLQWSTSGTTDGGIYYYGTDDRMEFYTGDTAGNPEMVLTATGRLGVGTQSPDANSQFHVVGTSYQPIYCNTTGTGGGGAVFLRSGTQALYVGSAGSSWLSGSSTADGLVRAEANLIFATNGNNQRAQIDSSGRLLVGTSSARTNVNILDQSDLTPSVQFEGQATSNRNTGLSIINYSASSYGSALTLGASKSNTLGTNALVTDGGDLGVINFVGADGTRFLSGAAIRAVADGTTGAGDMPSRLVFSTTADGASSPTERMRIANTGLIRAFSSEGIFRVNSSQGAGTTYELFWGGYGGSSTTSEGTNSIKIYTNGNIQNTNNSYTALSDIKLKENVVDANSQWNDLKALKVRNYNLKEGQTHKQIGLIAQEVEPISPGLVYESPDRDAEGNDLGTVTKSVNYSVLYMKAVKALQEAMERIEQLEAKVAALEGA